MSAYGGLFPRSGWQGYYILVCMISLKGNKSYSEGQICRNDRHVGWTIMSEGHF